MNINMKKITITFAILIALSFLVFSCITHEENTNESSKSTLQKRVTKFLQGFNLISRSQIQVEI